MADLTQLTKSGKATRHRFLDMHPHRQVTVYVDAEITDELHWSDVDAVAQHSSRWKLMLVLADHTETMRCSALQLKHSAVRHTTGISRSTANMEVVFCSICN